MFHSEICKRLELDVHIEFIKCKSYKGEASEELEIISEFKWDLAKGAYVLLVDDMCDSGKTLFKLSKKF